HARFGMRTLPFTREIEVERLYPHAATAEVLEELLAVIDKRMSAALIGAAGSGKSTLLRSLVSRLPEGRYRTHYVKVTGLGKRDMCREIARSLQLEPAGSYPRLVHVIQEAVTARSGEAATRTVLILDEAHDLRPEVLSTLRVLTNFAMDSRLMLSVILAGQPP